MMMKCGSGGRIIEGNGDEMTIFSVENMVRCVLNTHRKVFIVSQQDTSWIMKLLRLIR